MKDPSEFNKNPTSPDGHDYRCADCYKKYKHQWDADRRAGIPGKRQKTHPRVMRAIRTTAGGRARLAGKRTITVRAKDAVASDPQALIAAWPADELCAISRLPMLTDGRHYRHPHYAQPDRIIPELGYVVGNVQWVRKCLNEWKSDAPLEALVTLGDWARDQLALPETAN